MGANQSSNSTWTNEDKAFANEILKYTQEVCKVTSDLVENEQKKIKSIVTLEDKFEKCDQQCKTMEDLKKCYKRSLID